jgi:hypothetical protein
MALGVRARRKGSHTTTFHIQRRGKAMTTVYRRLRGVGALLAATAAAILAIAVPVHADPTAQARPGWHRMTATDLRATASRPVSAAAVPWYYVVNVNSGQTLAVSAGSDTNGAAIIQWPAIAGAQEQAWTPYRDDEGFLVWRNAGTSSWKAAGISASSTANGAKAIQWDYRPGLQDQEWWVVDYGDDTYAFKNRNSERCLAIPGGSQTRGTQAIQWTCNNGREQRWKLVPWS